MANEIGSAYLVVLPQLDSDFEATLGSLVAGAGDFPIAVTPEVTSDVGGEVADQVDQAGPAVTAAAVALGVLISDGVTAGLSAAIGIAQGLPDIGLQFQQTRAQIRGATGETGDALAKLHEIANDIFKTSPAALDDITTAVDLVHQRLELPPEDLENISRRIVQLARITGTDVKQMADDTTGMFNLWAIGADQQEGSLDKLLRVSQQTGVGVGDITGQLSGAGLQLQSLGFTFDDSIALIGNLGRSGLDLSVATAAFRKSLSEAAKEGKPANEVFKDLYDRIKNAPDQTTAAGIAVENFGARGTQMAAAIRNGQFAWEDLESSIQSGDTVQTAAGDVATFASKFEVLKHNAELAFEPIASGLADTLLGIGNFAGDVWNTFQTEGWDAAWKKITDKASLIWDGDPSTGEEGIHAKLNRFIDNIPGWLTTAAETVAKDAPKMLKAAVEWADNVWNGDPATGEEGLRAKLERALDALPGWVGEKIVTIADAFGRFAESAADWADKVWEGDPDHGQEGLKVKLQKVLDAIPGWAQERGEAIKQAVITWAPKFNAWADKLWNGDPDTGDEGLKVKLDRMFQSLDTYIADQGPSLYFQGEYIAVKLMEGLFGLSFIITGYASHFFVTLWKAFTDISWMFTKLGVTIAGTIIKAMLNVMPDQIRSALEFAVPELKDLEKIVGFAEGGVVDVALGQATLAVVHGGERVLTPAQNATYEAGGNALRSTSAAAPGQVVNIGTIVSDRPEPTAREVILQLREERWLASA